MKQRFAMVNEAMLADERLSYRQFKILCCLRMFADSKTGLAHPSRAQIREITGVQENHISAATTDLVNLGWLEKHGNGGRSSPADYQVMNEPKTLPKSGLKTLPKSGLKTIPESGTVSKKKPSPIRDETLPKSGLKPSPIRDLNPPQIGDTHTTDHQQTNNRPITDQFPEGEKTSPSQPAEIDGHETALQAHCRATWAAYVEAYSTRYGVAPVRNQQVNSQVKGFVKRIGGMEAPLVASWFVGHNDSWYVKTGHSVAALLRDAEKLRTEWATNQRMTTTRARQIDATQSNLSAIDQAKAIVRRRQA